MTCPVYIILGHNGHSLIISLMVLPSIQSAIAFSCRQKPAAGSIFSINQWRLRPANMEKSPNWGVFHFYLWENTNHTRQA